jgi:FixJ family two-component response regulator
LTAPNSDPCEVIYLVDGERSFRAKLSAFLAELGMKAIAFATAAEYLDFAGIESAACVILNSRLPDLSGLELQRQISDSPSPPIIFISEDADVASVVSAMKGGAIDFLTHPFDLSVLVAAIRVAIAQNRRRRKEKADLAILKDRFALLTPREREVLSLVVGGLLNKQAASLLGISEVTVQIHRSRVMRKMKAESLPELVRMSIRLHVQPWHRDAPDLDHHSGGPSVSFASPNVVAAEARERHGATGRLQWQTT